MGVTATLSAFTAGIRPDTLPPAVVDRARFLVLDLVGNIVRARYDAKSTASFLAAARAMGWDSYGCRALYAGPAGGGVAGDQYRIDREAEPNWCRPPVWPSNSWVCAT